MSSTKLTSLLPFLCFVIVSSYPNSQEKQILVAQVWSEKDYQGTSAYLIINAVSECTPFPEHFQENVKSLKVSIAIGNVWFFEEKGCNGLQLKTNPGQQIPDLDIVVGLPGNYSLNFFLLDIH